MKRKTVKLIEVPKKALRSAALSKDAHVDTLDDFLIICGHIAHHKFEQEAAQHRYADLLKSIQHHDDHTIH
jgi:hypothetical protein